MLVRVLCVKGRAGMTQRQAPLGCRNGLRKGLVDPRRVILDMLPVRQLLVALRMRTIDLLAVWDTA